MFLNYTCLICLLYIYILRTFPVPILTPYELEIGLGAREWDSCLITNYEYTFPENNSIEWEDKLEKVKLYNYEVDDNIDEHEDEEVLINNNGITTEESVNNRVLMLRRKEEENAIMEFKSSGAIQYYENRNYKGLVPNVQENEDMDINIIHKGQHGIASNYK